MVLLHDLAARVGTTSEEHEYGENQVVWLENGRKVLDYMEADERFSAASFKDSMEEQGIAVNRNWSSTSMPAERSGQGPGDQHRSVHFAPRLAPLLRQQ